MPRTTVYIRNDDWDKWKNVVNKSEMISRAINEPSGDKDEPLAAPEVTRPVKSGPELNVKSYEFCKHNAVVGMCKAGC